MPLSELRMFGPPGTGKTTRLAQRIARAAEKFGDDRLLVVSHTRGAARELMSRKLNVPRENVGTLHAICFRLLGQPKIAEANVGSWNDENPTMRITKTRANFDDAFADAERDDGTTARGDDLLAEIGLNRARIIPREYWRTDLRAFDTKWRAWKADCGFFDFTDLIEACLHDVDSPGAIDVAFVDEAQDFTPLQMTLIRKWAANMEYMLITGDDDQCHPAGTKILTTNRGYIPIENLIEHFDRLLTYNKEGQELYYREKDRQSWNRAKRDFNDLMITISTNKSDIQATFDHRILIKWSNEAIGKKAVYLMKRKNTWRTGTTDLIRKKAKGIFGIGQRARQERADCAWLLSVHNSTQDALLEEDRLALKYGISKMVFYAPMSGTRIIHSQKALDDHHVRVSIDARPLELLFDYGLKQEFPLWEKDGKQRGTTAHQIIRACNVITEVMKVAIYEEGKSNIEWSNVIDVKRKLFNGMVYSLNVEPHHTYIAGGMVTPNCIFSFAGASPTVMMEPEIDAKFIEVLSQSYRVPRAVHAFAEKLAQRISHRVAKTYHPRDADGVVETLKKTTMKEVSGIMPIIERAERDNETVMILASCSYMLAKTIEFLRREGVPFHNPYRRTRGDWNPLARRKNAQGALDRLAALLTPTAGFPPEWSRNQLASWTKHVSSQYLMRGVKRRLDDENNMDEITYREAFNADDAQLLERFINSEIEPAAVLNWFQPRLLSSHEPRYRFPLNIVKQRGLDGAQATPRVITGTVHSVKGGEATNVILFPDLSPSGMAELTAGGETADNVLRIFYVGATRARNRLYLCAPSSSIAMKL